MTAEPADRPLSRNPDFALLWVAQAISQTAQNAVNYGLLVLVQTRSNSSAQLSLAILTVILPSVLFGLVAGAYVDRRDKRWVLIGTNALRAGAMLGFILFTDQLPLVYLASFVFSTISQFFAPAEAAMIPAIVDRRRLIQANSLFHLTFTVSQLAGLVLLGPLVVNLIGLDGLFALVAVALAACAALLWPLPSTRHPTQEGDRGFGALVGDVRVVLRVIGRDRPMAWAMLHWTLGSTLGIILATLAPGFVVNVVGIRAEDSVFVLAPAGVGMVLGTAVLSRWGAGLERRRLVVTGLFGIGAALCFLAAVGSIWEGMLGREGLPGRGAGATILQINGLIAVVMATALTAGAAFVAVVIPSQTLIQEHAPPDVRGRVFAVQFVLSNVVGIVPLLLLGELADRVGVEWTLAVVGLVVLGVGAASARLAPPSEPRSDRYPTTGSGAESAA